MLDDKTSLIRKLIWHANHAGRMRQPEIRALLGFALEAVEDISSKHSERREVWEAKTYVAAVIGCRHPIHDQDAKEAFLLAANAIRSVRISRIGAQ